MRLQKSEIKVLGLSSLGGMLEFYDFIIFVFLQRLSLVYFFLAHLIHFGRILILMELLQQDILQDHWAGLLWHILAIKVGVKRCLCSQSCLW